MFKSNFIFSVNLYQILYLLINTPFLILFTRAIIPISHSMFTSLKNDKAIALCFASKFRI